MFRWSGYNWAKGHVEYAGSRRQPSPQALLCPYALPRSLPRQSLGRKGHPQKLCAPLAADVNLLSFKELISVITMLSEWRRPS